MEPANRIEFTVWDCFCKLEAKLKVAWESYHYYLEQKYGNTLVIAKFMQKISVKKSQEYIRYFFNISEVQQGWEKWPDLIL